jgi:alkylhydroperoxidase family enzyme
MQGATMPRLTAKPVAELAEYDEMFRSLEELFGFLPNDYLSMGHKPMIMKAVVDLTGAVLLTEGKTPLSLRLLVMYLSSRAAGCMYCTAHLAVLSERNGIGLEKIQNIREYLTFPEFTAAERAALTVADHANKLPNAVTDEDFAALHQHFDDEAIAEIISQIALMSFYNKWNDTLATTLEKPPLEMASKSLPWWQVGKHER